MNYILLTALVGGLAVTGLNAQDRPSDWNWKEGRESMVKLSKGKPEAALRELLALKAEFPERAELEFALCATYAALGNVDLALEAMERSIRLGTPVSRFLLGPAPYLDPIRDHQKFIELTASWSSPLAHGPLLGSQTDSSVSVWTRWLKCGDFSVEWLDGDQWRRSDVVSVSPEKDHGVGRATLSGLPANQKIQYRLVWNGRPLEMVYDFQSMPLEGTPSSFSIAFGGGAAFTPAFEKMFDVINDHDPVAFLQLGDNVYIDQPTLPEVQRYCYYRRQSSDPYRRLISGVNIAAIWDDHDFSDDDSWGGPEVENPPWKRVVWRLFKEQWNNPGYGGGESHPGCYFDFMIGDVHFIMLDCRYYRTSPRIPESDRSMLGPVQKQWLKDTLKNSTATMRVIASSVPISQGVKPGSRDPWDGYALEREELYSFIESESIERVLFIAADRHRSDIWKTSRASGRTFFEFQSSRLTNLHTHGVLKSSIFGYRDQPSFGKLTLNTQKTPPEVTYSIINLENELVFEWTLPVD